MTTQSRRMDNWYAWDFETSGNNAHTCTIVGVGITGFNIKSGEPHTSTFYPYDMFQSIPKDFFTSYTVAHNAKFELMIAKRLGWVFERTVHDTFIMAKTLHNAFPSYTLKYLSWVYFGDMYEELQDIRDWLQANSGKTEDDEDLFDLALPPLPLVSRYCLKDCANTAALAHQWYPELKDSYAYELDIETIPCVVDMECHGIHIDQEFYSEFVRLATRRMKRNKTTAAENMPICKGRNPKGDALREHLFELGEVRRTAKGHVAASEVVLRDWLGDAAVRAIARIKSDEKNVGTYAANFLGAMDKDGLVFPSVRQSAAITRRFRGAGFYSSEGDKRKGNIQAVPHIMRLGITARKGHLFYKQDLASIEARIFSAYMEMLLGVSDFAELYRVDKNFNVYVHVLKTCADEWDASKKHPLYAAYKHGVLARLYGSSVQRYTIQMREDFELDYTEERCASIFKEIDRNFPFIRDFQRFMMKLAETQGFVTDPFGSIYYFPPEDSYKIIAYLCQGSAGMVLKWWWCRIQPMLRQNNDKVVITVHDELDYEIQKHKVNGLTPRQRVKTYADVLNELDLFDLPILAETDGPLKNWGD